MHKAADGAMTIANMRGLGVTTVDATCACGHEAIVDVTALPGEVVVPSLRFRFRCSACGRRPAFVRPNWLEMTAAGMGRSFGTENRLRRD